MSSSGLFVRKRFSFWKTNVIFCTFNSKMLFYEFCTVRASHFSLFHLALIENASLRKIMFYKVAEFPDKMSTDHEDQVLGKQRPDGKMGRGGARHWLGRRTWLQRFRLAPKFINDGKYYFQQRIFYASWDIKWNKVKEEKILLQALNKIHFLKRLPDFQEHGLGPKV